MAEYIEREAVLKARHGCDGDCETCDFYIDGDSWCSGEVFIVDVFRIPAADVRPVKRGKWVWLSSTYDRVPCEMRFWCSNCHHEVITHSQDPWEHYCPNCGARMCNEEEQT